MENERNLITGTTMSKRDDTVHNPITGGYREADESDNKVVAKGDNLLWPSISGQADDDDGEFEKHIPIFVKKADERIVCGVVYEPDEVDSQGDQASAEEIKKACYHFMEKARQLKVMHKGKKVNVEILENYLAPQDLTVGKKKIKKGSWVMVVRVNDSKIWKAIKDGELTGFSMAGSAKVD